VSPFSLLRGFLFMSRYLQSTKDVLRPWDASSIDAARGFQRAATNVAAAMLIAVAAVGCGGQQAGGPQAPPPTPVKVATVHPAPVADASELVATIKSLSSTTIHPQVDGQITRIYVKSGDRVKAGTPLLQIDPLRQQAAVASQDSARAAQEANVAFAQQQLNRAKELIAVGAISKQELEQAETNLNTARAQLSALSAQVKEQSVTLGYYQVLAPTSGIVGDIPVRVGMRVSPDTLLTTVDQNQDLEVYVSVPLERAPALKRGLPIQIVDGQGNKLAETTINYISPTVDDQTQSILVKGNVKGGEGNALRSAQFVRARVIWKTDDGLVVPVVAVIRINGKHFVYVSENKDGKSVARQRPVTLGQIIKDDYTVLGGLKANEQVVISGVQKLIDGAPIAPSA
jgi:RND family efflux transporter MFP subunit